jgi:hypothetical protein
VNVAALLLLAFRVSRVSRVVRLVWLTTSIPALVTLGWYCLTGVYIVETAKICAPWILYTGQVVVAFGGNHRERELMLKGIFAGIIVNAVVCVLQSITVPLEMFPLEAIYPPAVVDSIAANAQGSMGALGIRVWGLFNEPSDMTGSIAFWVLLLIGVRLGLGVSGSLAAIFCSRLGAIAQICGIIVLILSRSGQILFFATGLMMVGATAVINLRNKRAVRQSRIRIAILAGVVACIMVAAVVDVNDRISSEQYRSGLGIQSSWTGRGDSILQSLGLWTRSGGYDFVFGLGFKGQDTLRSLTRMNVWSVVASSVLAFGFLGALSWLLLLGFVVKSVLRSGARVLGLAVALNVFGALMFTVSSVSMLSLWIGVVLLALWNRLFPPPVNPRFACARRVVWTMRSGAGKELRPVLVPSPMERV